MTRYHSRRHPFRITPKERRSFELVLQGLTLREIAAREGRAVNTIEVQVRTCVEKMGAKTLAQAAYQAGRESNEQP